MPIFQDNTETIEKVKTDYIKIEPDLYKVLLLNDDFTTMDFVVVALQTIFNKTDKEAEEIMLSVHKKGYGVAGIYVEDVANSKAAITLDFAKQNGFGHFKVKVEKE